MQPATHKKIVFGALGCGGLLAVFTVVSFLSVRKWGFETPQSQLPVAPLQAAAALDSLSEYDLAALTAPLVTDSLLPAAPPVAAMVARWNREGHVILSFGDTFPPDSWQGRLWRTARGFATRRPRPPGGGSVRAGRRRLGRGATNGDARHPAGAGAPGPA